MSEMITINDSQEDNGSEYDRYDADGEYEDVACEKKKKKIKRKHHSDKINRSFHLEGESLENAVHFNIKMSVYLLLFPVVVDLLLLLFKQKPFFGGG